MAQIISYSGLTRKEFENVRDTIKKEVKSLNFRYNKTYGTVSISPNKKRNYQWNMELGLKILGMLEELGMFTLRHKKELQCLLDVGMKGSGLISNQVFSMVYKLN